GGADAAEAVAHPAAAGVAGKVAVRVGVKIEGKATGEIEGEGAAGVVARRGSAFRRPRVEDPAAERGKEWGLIKRGNHARDVGRLNQPRRTAEEFSPLQQFKIERLPFSRILPLGGRLPSLFPKPIQSQLSQ